MSLFEGICAFILKMLSIFVPLLKIPYKKEEIKEEIKAKCLHMCENDMKPLKRSTEFGKKTHEQNDLCEWANSLNQLALIKLIIDRWIF